MPSLSQHITPQFLGVSKPVDFSGHVGRKEQGIHSSFYSLNPSWLKNSLADPWFPGQRQSADAFTLCPPFSLFPRSRGNFRVHSTFALVRVCSYQISFASSLPSIFLTYPQGLPMDVSFTLVSLLYVFLAWFGAVSLIVYIYTRNWLLYLHWPCYDLDTFDCF